MATGGYARRSGAGAGVRDGQPLRRRCGMADVDQYIRDLEEKVASAAVAPHGSASLVQKVDEIAVALDLVEHKVASVARLVRTTQAFAEEEANARNKAIVEVEKKLAALDKKVCEQVAQVDANATAATRAVDARLSASIDAVGAAVAAAERKTSSSIAKVESATSNAGDAATEARSLQRVQRDELQKLASDQAQLQQQLTGLLSAVEQQAAEMAQRKTQAQPDYVRIERKISALTKAEFKRLEEQLIKEIKSMEVRAVDKATTAQSKVVEEYETEARRQQNEMRLDLRALERRVLHRRSIDGDSDKPAHELADFSSQASVPPATFRKGLQEVVEVCNILRNSVLKIQRDVQETQETMSELKEEFARRKTGDACKITENSQLKEALRTPCTVPKQAKIGNDAAAHRSEGKERPKTTFQERKQKLGQLYSELERIGHCV